MAETIETTTSRYRIVLFVFSATLLLSAFLLFSMQPMFAKMVLPMLGGTPSVWNTCMVFFQAMLLLGYTYAHLICARLNPRAQSIIHIGVLLLPFLVLPIRIPLGLSPPSSTSPIPWLLMLLTTAIGLPFLVVSTSAPLMQGWLSLTRHPDAKDPYFLYAASNLGSLAALLSYPTLIEPHLRLVDQAGAWMIGYCILAILIAMCSIFVRTEAKRVPLGPQAHTDNSSLSATSGTTEPLVNARRLKWVLLSFVPSSLMLGVTTYLSTDIAAIPLLWVIPLALYLITFIFVFSRKQIIPRALLLWALPIIILPLAALIIIGANSPPWLLIPLHLAMFFVASMICHNELACDRPTAAHLTEFYLWIAFGGVLGGLFNSLIAPVIFKTVLEYPLAMVFACLLRPTIGTIHPHTKDIGLVVKRTKYSRWLDYLIPLALGGLMVALLGVIQHSHIESKLARQSIFLLPPILVCYLCRYQPVRFGLAVGSLLFTGTFITSDWKHSGYMDRSFFGVYRVVSVYEKNGAYHRLMSGTTLHGAQNLNPNHRREPLTYFHVSGPLGHVFDAFAEMPGKLNAVAVIGLGTGSSACYATPAQQWTFYEIDPAVVKIAINPEQFTFIRDCLERFSVVLGDARLTLARAPKNSYMLIIVDAFSSDAIPIHLITQQALHMYLDKLADNGLIAFHISNRYLDLEPILGNIAAAEKLEAISWFDADINQEAMQHGKTLSRWVVIARRKADFGKLASDPRWHLIRRQARPLVWTDDFSNLLSAFRWK